MEPGLDGTDDGKKGRRAWEWAGLQEFVGTCILLAVLLGGALGMLLRMMNPRRKALALGHAVHQAARNAQEAAADVLVPSADADEDDVNASV